MYYLYTQNHVGAIVGKPKRSRSMNLVNQFKLEKGPLVRLNPNDGNLLLESHKTVLERWTDICGYVYTVVKDDIEIVKIRLSQEEGTNLFYFSTVPPKIAPLFFVNTISVEQILRFQKSFVAKLLEIHPHMDVCKLVATDIQTFVDEGD